jgi:protein SCO1
MKVYGVNRKWVVLLIIAIVILSACGKKEIQNALNYPVEDFNYSNQDGETFGLEDLKGKVWVADFIFTSCLDVCSPMTFHMEKLQKMAKKEGVTNIEFVSFSVDPSLDTPEKLKEFGENFNVDFANWNFLTGYKQKEIENFALKSFKTLVLKPQQGDQVIHGTDFYLVGPKGTVLKYYTGLNEIPFKEIINDIKSLQD